MPCTASTKRAPAGPSSPRRLAFLGRQLAPLSGFCFLPEVFWVQWGAGPQSLSYKGIVPVWGGGQSLSMGAASVLSADIVNADKMSGRSRKYKIIFSPQKVSGCCFHQRPTALCLSGPLLSPQKHLTKANGGVSGKESVPSAAGSSLPASVGAGLRASSCLAVLCL